MTEKPSLASLLEREIEAHRTVRPPWGRLPGIHPLDVAWRTGEGETQLLLWGRWLSGLAPTDAWARALVAVRAHAPVPADWAFWVLDALGLATEDDPYQHTFDDAKKRLGEVGLEVAGTPTASD